MYEYVVAVLKRKVSKPASQRQQQTTGTVLLKTKTNSAQFNRLYHTAAVPTILTTKQENRMDMLMRALI